MDTLSTHHARLLEIDESWKVEDVNLQVDQRRVEIRLAHVGRGVFCPECGRPCGLADHAEERRWRHLDTMQHVTEVVTRLPRCRCPEHGVKTVVPPWAAKHSRFTLLFEAFAVEVLQACRTINAAAAMLKLPWDAVQTIMDRAVARGLVRRAHLLRELFQQFWDYVSPTCAEKFLDTWCISAMPSKLEPMKKVAKSLRRHRHLILNWFRAKGTISSGVVEGLNGVVETDYQKSIRLQDCERH